MNRDQKAVAIEEIATQIDESHAIFAVDYRGISVPQVAELRAKLREADATFKVVKNSLTERAADQAGADTLKEYLAGPTALTFVRGDAATAAKAIADYARATQLLPFKGGLMDGGTLDVEQLRSLSRLPSRDVLYGQLVGVVASPVGGLVRSLSALVGGLAAALGQVREKKESGEIPAGEPPAASAATEAPAAAPSDGEASAPESAEASATEQAAPEAEETPAAEPAAAAEDAPTTEPAAQAENAAAAEPAAEADDTAAEPAAEADDAAAVEPAAEAAAEAPAQEPAAEQTSDAKAEPASEPAQDDDKQADASAEAEQDPADAKSTKED
jgi:large subunit ribosomal protein L10